MATQDNNSYWNSVSISYKDRTKKNYQSEFEELSKRFDNGEITEEEFNQEIDNIQKKYGVFWEEEKQQAEEEQKRQEALNENKRNGLKDFRDNYRNLINSYKRLSDNKEIKDEDKNALIDVVYKNYIREGHEDNNDTKQLITEEWNKGTNDENITWAAKVIAKNAYKSGLITKEQYDRFWEEGDDYFKLGQLAQLSKILSDKTYADEIREQVAENVKRNSAFGENEDQINLNKFKKEGFDKIIDGISKLAEKQKDKSKFGRVLEDLAFLSSPLISMLESKDAREINAGVAEMAGASILHVIDGITQGAARLIGNPFHGTGKAKTIDNITEDLANSYLSHLSYSTENELKNAIKRGDITLEEIQADFDNLSENSSVYKQLTSGTKRNQKILDRINDNKKRGKKDDIEIEDEKITEYAKLITLSQEFDDNAALNHLNEYWKSNAARYQTLWDYTANTGGQFASTFIADVVSTAAIFGSAISVFNPDDKNFGNFNIVEDLVTDNSLMRYASDLQMTGAFSREKQKQYKETNVNKYQTFKTSEQENQMLSVRDIPELIGQYGFTAATTAISMGGSAVVKGLSTSIARNTLQQGLRATGREIRKKTTRQLLKDALESGISKQEIRSAFENAVKKASTTMYYGNLVVAGTVGTAEGALESISTFDEFMKNKDMVDAWRNGILDSFVTEETAPYLEALMRKDGIKPKGFETVLEGENQVGKAVYTTDQYRDAVIKYISSEPQEAYEIVLDRLKEDGVDAATANFLSNSFINGILNICLKELTLSKDAQSAVRAARGERGYSNIAATRNDKRYTGFERTKTTRENWKDYISDSVFGRTVKQSTGEFIEEYSQNISDRVSRAVFEQDLINTMEKVMNLDAKEAIGRDWVDLLNTGFDELGSSLTDKEAIKEGIYGFLSSAVGGFSPANLSKYTSAVSKNWAENMSMPGHRNFAGFAGRLITDLGYFYDGAIAQNYRQSKGEENNDQRFIDYLNAWFGNDDTRKLLSGLTSATAYMSDKGIGEDNQSKFDYKDGELGVLIETAIIMNELNENPLIAFYLKRLETLKNINIEEAKELLEDKNSTEELVVLYKDLINQFRQSNKDKTALSDIEVLSRIKKNAEDFFKVKETIDTESKHLDDLFYGQDLDPIVKRTLIHALMTSKDSDERAGKIERMMADFFDNTNTFSSADKKNDKKNKRKHFIARYGSIKNLDSQIEEYESKLDKTEDKYEIEFYKYNIKELQKDKKEWDEADLEDAITDNEGKLVIITSGIITADEMKTLPFDVVARMVINRNKPLYYQAQKDEIQKYLQEINDSQLRNGFNESTVDNVIEDIEDYGILKERRDKYIGLLNGYINNPRFLNQTAMDLRKKDRERTLKYLYKDYFNIGDGQTQQDYIDSIEKKEKELRDKDEFEAKEFDEVVSKNSSIFRKYKQAVSQINRLQKNELLARNTNGKPLTEEEKKANTGYRAMLLAFSKNLPITVDSDKAGEETIKQLLNALDKNEKKLLNALKSKNTSGDYVLNQVREMLGLEALPDSFFDDNSLKRELDNLKKYLNSHTGGVDQGRPAGESRTNQDRKMKDESPADKSSPSNISVESQNLEIVPIASSTKEEQEFLRQYGASSVAENITGRGIKIRLFKVKGYNRLLAVIETDQTIPNATSIPEIKKDRKNLYPLGFIKEGSSSSLEKQLKENTDKQYSEISIPEAAKSRMTFIQQGSEEPRGSHESVGYQDARAAIDGMQSLKQESSLIDKIKEYVKGVLNRNGRESTDRRGKSYPAFVDAFGHPLFKKTHSDGSFLNIFDIELSEGDGVTLVRDFLQDESLSDEEIIKKLRENKFFDTFFSTWENKILTGSDKTIIKSLIGDYLYLGPSIEEELYSDSKEGKTFIRIKNTNANKTVLEVQIGEGNKSNESLALKFLKDLFELQLQTVDIKFSHVLPQTPNPLSIKDIKSQQQKERYSNILIGLIQGGLMEALPEGESKRKLTVANPFYTKEKQKGKIVKENGPSTDNNGTNLNPGGIVQKQEPVNMEMSKSQKKTDNTIDNIYNKHQKNIVRSDETTEEERKKFSDEENDSFYIIKESGEEKKAARVTQLEHAVVGGTATKYDGQIGPTTATANGNIYDRIGKGIIAIMMKTPSITTDELMKEIIKLFGEKIPNHNEIGVENLKKYLENFQKFVGNAIKQGWVFKTNDMRVTADIPVYDGQTQIGTIKVAGEIDLMAIDKNGNAYIIDLKTTRLKNTITTIDTQINESKNNWQAQTSTYCYAIENMSADNEYVKIAGLFVLPTFLSYINPPANSIVSEDGMTIKTQKGENAEIISKQVLKSNSNDFEDYLVPIDKIESEQGIKGYDYNKLGKQYQEMVIPISSKTEGLNKDRSGSDEVKSELGKPRDKAEIPDDLDLTLSKRTRAEAANTDFINNHVAPVESTKVSFFGKVAAKTKGLFASESKIVHAYKSDLANTFFGGSISKLESIIGKRNITLNTLGETLKKIASYFESYMKNAEALKNNIEVQYHAARITYDFFSSKITIDQVESELEKFGLTPQNISEIAEYFNSKNQEEYARSILSKLEESKVHTQEVYEERMSNLNMTIEAMKARLDFLNSSNASARMKQRLQSLKVALQNDSFDVLSQTDDFDLNTILKNKNGIYGARNLLEQVIKRTGNKNFKTLAQTILNELISKNITVAVIINDGASSDIEGEASKNTVIMQSASTESFEKFERVLLHEMIHILVDNSPKLKESIYEIYNQTIDRMAAISGDSRSAIKSSYYGFKNVDEFISEFFTNYAFQEQLRSLDTANGDNAFDRFIVNLKNMFGNTMFSKISDAMNSIVPTTNIENQNRKTRIIEEKSRFKDNFDNLSKDMQREIKKLGFNRKSFDNLTSKEQFAIKQCCM